MKRILQLLVVAVILINISLASTISKVEIKEIDGKVKISLNTVTSYKTFFKDDKVRVLLKDSQINLSQTEANLMPGGPVSKVSLSSDGNNSYLDIFLNYSNVNYKVYVSNGLTIVEVNQKDLPEPPGPKTVYAESKGVRNYIVLSAPEESSKVHSKSESTKNNEVENKTVEVKKVEVKKHYSKTKSDVKSGVRNTVKSSVKDGSSNIVSKSKKITLDLVDATLVDTVRLITENLGWNVIFSPDVMKYQEKLTMKLVNVEPEKALKMILLANGFDYKIVNEIAYVATPDKLEKFQQDIKVTGPMKTQVINLENATAREIEPIVKANFPEASVQVVEKTNSLLVKAPVKTIVDIKNLVGQLDVPPPPPPPVTPPVTEVIRLNYAQAQDVVQMMGNLVPKEALTVDQRMNSLIVTATPDIIDTVKSFVKAVDVPMPQVALRLHVLLINEGAQRTLGVTWNQSVSTNLQEVKKVYDNNTGWSFQTGPSDYLGIQLFTRSMLQFQATLNYVVANGDTKILAAPYVMTQNRQQAEIQIGEQFPLIYTDYRTGQQQAQYINVGIILRITPEISPDGYVTLQLNPEVSEVGEIITGTQFPRILTRRVNNMVRVKQGETVLIGGLFREAVTDSITKIPLLGDIPIIGEFFKARSKRKDKSELMIAVTPVVLVDLPKLEKTEQYKKIEDRGLKVKDADKY